jgi:hypothetical protein
MDNKIIKTKIVYIPIEVGDRLPEDSGIYYTDGKRGKDFYKKGNVGFDDDANFWLEPTEAYVFTPEELGEILTKYITEVNKESITSQLIEFLKELK